MLGEFGDIETLVVGSVVAGGWAIVEAPAVREAEAGWGDAEVVGVAESETGGRADVETAVVGGTAAGTRAVDWVGGVVTGRGVRLVGVVVDRGPAAIDGVLV